MDLFSNLQLLHEAAISVLVTTIYGRWRGITCRTFVEDETVDTFITFPHRTLQEFLGALYFILMLNAGESIGNLLSYFCNEPILLNPLFFHFCPWFLHSDQEYFTFENRNQVCESLVMFCTGKNISTQVELSKVKESYPAIDIELAFANYDEMSLRFFKEMLAKCKTQIKAISVKFLHILQWILTILKTKLTFACSSKFYMTWITDEHVKMYMIYEGIRNEKPPSKFTKFETNYQWC